MGIIFFFLLSASILISAINAQQGQLSVKGGYGLGIPTGDLRDFYSKVGLGGGGISLNYMALKDIEAGIDVSYIHFAEKGGNAVANLPITLNVRYLMDLDRFKPFLGLGVGVSLMTHQIEHSPIYKFVYTWNAHCGTYFTLSDVVDLETSFANNIVMSDGVIFKNSDVKRKVIYNSDYVQLRLGVRIKL